MTDPETQYGLGLMEKNRLYYATTTQLFPDFVILSQHEGHTGCRVWGQIKGQEPRLFLDFTAGVGVNALGYGDTPSARAIIKQAQTGMLYYTHNDWAVDSAILLAERLAKITTGDFPKKVFFCNSGAEAINAAAKLGFALDWEELLHAETVNAAVELARSAGRGQRYGLIAFEKAFHGRVGYALDLTSSKPVQTEGFLSGAKVFHIPFPDRFDPKYDFETWKRRALFFLEDCTVRPNNSGLPRLAVAGVFELVQGEGGIRVADLKAIKFLYGYLRERGILFIDDEVMTGIGRTGRFLASDHYGIEPDVICLAKALGGGVPIGAIVYRAELDFNKGGRHSNTFGGGPLSCSAALAVLDVVCNEQFLDEVRQSGHYLLAALERVVAELSAPGKLSVRASGLGLMCKLEFRGPMGEPRPELCKAILRNCLERGLLVLTAGESAIRFLPPLTITTSEIAEGMEIFTEAAKEVLSE